MPPYLKTKEITFFSLLSFNKRKAGNFLLLEVTLYQWKALLNPPWDPFISQSFSFLSHRWCFSPSHSVVREVKRKTRAGRLQRNCLLSLRCVNPLLFPLAFSVCCYFCRNPPTSNSASLNESMTRKGQTWTCGPLFATDHILGIRCVLTQSFSSRNKLTSYFTASDTIDLIWGVYLSYCRGKNF